MLKMKSLRTFRLETKKGHVIMFEANVPKAVPDDAVADAMAAGCAPEDPDDAPFYEDLQRARVEFQGDVRNSLVYMAIDTLMRQNNTKHFDGSGNPKHEAVSELLGFSVFAEETLAMFRIYLQAKSEGQEYTLHPNANSALRVIEADSKAELLELAEEFGVDKAKAKGLNVRELRKMLLVKLSGVAPE